MAIKTSRNNKHKPNHKTYEEQNHLKLAQITPLNVNQEIAFDYYDDDLNLILIGSAGTGKTFLSFFLALEEILTGDTEYKKLVIVRSAVPTRDMGFLPGSLKEKAMVYEAPYYEICNDLFGRGDAYDLLKKKGLIEFITTSYVRGTTLRDCIVIVDEIQNLDNQELNSIITRVGKNCKIIFCGDCAQDDLKRETTGFYKFIAIARNMESFGIIEFGTKDIVRSELVKQWIIQKEKYETKTFQPSNLKPAFEPAD